MSSFNRIPRDSVSFSNQSVLFDIELEDFRTTVGTKEEAEVPVKSEMEKREDILIEKELSVLEKEKELLLLEEKLKEEYEKIISDKEEFDMEMQHVMTQHEKQKRRDYYELRGFVWEQSILMAKEIVRQSIETKQLSIKKVFDGLIEQLPIAIDELEVTVHPFTLEYINSEETKEAWVLNNIKWKLDYSLEIGDFILETEKEYYDYRFDSLFNEIKKRIEKKFLESREGGY